MPEEENTRCRNEIWTRIRQMRPTASTALSAIVHEAGKIETQPGPILEELRKHWGEVFKGKGIDKCKHHQPRT